MAKKDNKKTDESKADRFKRLAEKRTTKAIKAIGMLRALSGSGYESKPDQHAKIISSLTAEIESVANAFKGQKQTAAAFKL